MSGEDRPMELMDGEAAQSYITQYLAKMTEKDMCAAFMIDIDNTAEFIEHFGQEAKDAVIHHVSRILSAHFRASDIVSQVGNDEFLAFRCGDITEDEVVRKAELLVECIQHEPKGLPGLRVTVCIGIYLGYGEKISFEKLFGQAAAALYKAKKSGRGSFCVLTNRKEWQKKREADQEVSGISVNTLLEYMDSGIGLLEIGPEIQFIYVSHGLYNMIGRDRESLPVPCSLRDIGIHPDYEPDYEEVLREGAQKDGVIDHVHRISANGKDWVWRHIRAARVAYPGRENPVMLEMSTDVSELIRTERQLRVSNERLRVAFRQTPHVLWEVDIEERTFNIYNVDEEKCQQGTVVSNFPLSFLENHIVHPDSASDFREFAENMLGGRSAGKGNFMMRDSVSHSYGWVAMSYRMTYDEEGRPLKAVGVQAKLPGLSGIGSSLMRRRPLPEVVRRHLIIRMEVNLTKNSVEEIWIRGMDQTAWTWGKTYSQVIEVEKKYLFALNSGKKFQERFERENLLQFYEKGDVWSTQEYRRVDEAGNISWIKDVVNLVRDADTGDIRMYACCIDSQIRHDWEKRSKGEIVRDSVTGLYNVETVKNIAKALIRGKNGTSCAFSLIRTMGEEKNASTDRSMAVALSMALGMDCVVGKYRNGIILALIPDCASRFDVKRRIEDAFAYLRVSMTDIPGMDNLRFVAGAVTCHVDEADFDEMLVRAELLSDQGKNLAVDTVFFPTEDEDWAWTSLRREARKDEVLVGEEIERSLTKEEQTVAFQCVTDMLSARSLETSIADALRDLGRFYNAARIYTLKVETDKQTIDMAFEWVAPGKQSIRHVMQEVDIKKIPLLWICYQEKLPVMREKPMNSSHPDESGKKWYFIACPLKKNGEVQGFLCVENAQAHAEDMALLKTLIPYIVGEETRFQIMSEQALSEGQDALTRLPNLSSYMDVIYSMDSDSYSSMGVLSLDIPHYSVINSSYGFEYGKKMLIYIAETLENVFGRTYIFRTWDAEFVVLFPNTIQEVFTGRCTRLRTMIQRRYPRQVRISYVWAEGVFSARHMVKEAQAIMRNENVKDPSGGRNEFQDVSRSQNDEIRKNFVPYFQPKVDMRDGSLIGVEALARKIGNDGSIIPPGRFIERMEENGTVRELDLFMLEGVLRQLCEWKEKEYPPIRVSLNISRVTLFNSSALASVLAIQSRYPEIPADQIELEITETAGDMEKATLAEVIDSFRQCGIEFELDDFGSGYANISVFSNIRFHTVKLDRVIVNDLPDNEISSMMVENITQICKSFGMQCIAEGVETQQQVAALLKAGCVYGQGFYYAKPLPAREFEKRYFNSRD